MFLLFDIGGTHTRLAVTADLRQIQEPKILNTPNTFEMGIKLIYEEALKLSKNTPFKAVAGGFAGTLSQQRKNIFHSSHLPLWSNKPLATVLNQTFDCPIFLENDAAIAGLGEALIGPGIGKNIVAYITISTGVGGVKIVNGKIDPSNLGYEPGHQIIDIRGPKCPTCQINGHLESFISSTALEQRCGKPPGEIKDILIWEEVADYLAVGLNNLIVHWSPEIIILGGGLTKSISLEKVVKKLHQLVTFYPEVPELALSKFDGLGGIYGALEYLKQNLGSNHP